MLAPEQAVMTSGAAMAEALRARLEVRLPGVRAGGLGDAREDAPVRQAPVRVEAENASAKAPRTAPANRGVKCTVESPDFFTLPRAS